MTLPHQLARQAFPVIMIVILSTTYFVWWERPSANDPLASVPRTPPQPAAEGLSPAGQQAGIPHPTPDRESDQKLAADDNRVQPIDLVEKRERGRGTTLRSQGQGGVVRIPTESTGEDRGVGEETENPWSVASAVAQAGATTESHKQPNSTSPLFSVLESRAETAQQRFHPVVPESVTDRPGVGGDVGSPVRMEHSAESEIDEEWGRGQPPQQELTVPDPSFGGRLLDNPYFEPSAPTQPLPHDPPPSQPSPHAPPPSQPSPQDPPPSQPSPQDPVPPALREATRASDAAQQRERVAATGRSRQPEESPSASILSQPVDPLETRERQEADSMGQRRALVQPQPPQLPPAPSHWLSPLAAEQDLQANRHQNGPRLEQSTQPAEHRSTEIPGGLAALSDHVRQQVLQHWEYGGSLARRNAIELAKREFYHGLSLIAEYADQTRGVPLRLPALQQGFVAINEAGDFQSSGELRQRNLQVIVQAHQTPLIREGHFVADSHARARQAYLMYAGQRLALAMEDQPLAAELLFSLGKLHLAIFQQGRRADHLDLARAEMLFETALWIDPGHERSCNELGVILAQNGRWSDARHLLQQAVAVRQDFLEAWQNLVTVHRRMEEWELAELAQRQVDRLRRQNDDDGGVRLVSNVEFAAIEAAMDYADGPPVQSAAVTSTAAGAAGQRPRPALPFQHRSSVQPRPFGAAQANTSENTTAIPFSTGHHPPGSISDQSPSRSSMPFRRP